MKAPRPSGKKFGVRPAPVKTRKTKRRKATALEQALHELKEHEWNFNGEMFFRARTICQHSDESKNPAVVCLLFWCEAEFGLSKFEVALAAVKEEIRGLLKQAGCPGVHFIFRVKGVPIEQAVHG